MNIYKELDIIIQDHCLKGSYNDEDNEVDDNKYDMLKDEINAHLHSDNPNITNLSPEAIAILDEWSDWKERYDEQYDNRY